MMREASTYGAITLPKYEHYINTRENQNELYQDELYQTNIINIVKTTLT